VTDHHHHTSLNRLAVQAPLHCLTGCGIGEVAGLVLGTVFGWSTATTIAAAIGLAFVFGYALTLRPLLQANVPWRQAVSLALAADTLSIALMEIVDNAIMLAIPGAMAAPLDSVLFWATLILALALAGLAAFPLNRWLIARGRGHAVVHTMHHVHLLAGVVLAGALR
jgi:hypothetical protein